MTLPINVELVKGSEAGAIDTDLLKGLYVKSITADTAANTLTIVGMDADGNETTLTLSVEISAGTTGVRLAVGWSTDQTAEASELTATSETETVIVPDHTTNDYLLIWTADGAGTLSAIYLGSSPGNSLSTYGDPVALELNGVAGTVRASTNRRIGNLVSGQTVRVEFA